MDIDLLKDDINLILHGIKMTSKKDMKYLKRDNNGVYHLVFRVPARFGGRLVRHSLFTNDYSVAASIRDRFVTPVLALQSGVHALEEIGKSIIQAEGDAVRHLSSITNLINAPQGLTLDEARDLYLAWITRSDYRPATIRKYTDYLNMVSEIIGGSHVVGMLSKQDAIRLRDRLQEDGKGATTIFHTFSIFRSFLRWLNKEGQITSAFVVENFNIDLPAVRKVNTPIIPPSLADEAMLALPGWTLVPRIERYTGMRIGEVEACLTGNLGCGIVEVEGFKCFRITKEFCKTHADRFVPVADKLAPFLTEEALEEARRQCVFTGDERRKESPAQKAYNRAIKKINGCEDCKNHSWRVYAQTMMIEAGVDDLIVKRIIGHKDSSNVHYGYTAARVEAMKKALDRIP